jgi:myo-inositol-1(or 4)-monophosphatase
MEELSSFLDIAIKAARKAGEIHLKYFSKNVRISTKSSHFDLVTNADIESEDAIVKMIRERFSDHNILAEEKKYEATDSGYLWIIDPLDGTNNFAHNIPIFSVSIALSYQGSLLLGIVFDPTRDELFHAEKDAGAFCNGVKIQVSKTEQLKDSVLTTGFYYDRGDRMKRTLKDIETFMLMGIVGIRRFGSAALDLCNVACGRGEGFWEFTLSPWDFAGGKLIVEQAGGSVTDEKGGSVPIAPSYIVASNGKIHSEMLKILK